MKLLSGIKEVIYKSDFFDSGSLLRVKGEPQHKTILGGVLSIIVMVLLIVAFYNKIIDTLNKALISSSSSISNANDPLPFNISTASNGPFMFAVEVLNHNLNEGGRYFNVQLTSVISRYGSIQNTSTSVMMQACTVDHWSGYPEIQQKFDQISMGNWKCLPKNANFEIKGKYSSQISKAMSISLNVCSNITSESRPCAPQAQIDQYFIEQEEKYFSLYFINPIINPDDQDYLTYYLEDINYVIFSPKFGGEATILIEDYSISTDESILPITSIETKTGGIVTNSAIKNFFQDVSSTYAVINIRKSSISNIINRSFQKLDDVFSYIGGLFGTVLMLFFLVSGYNTYKFEVNLAGYLFKAANDKLEKSYNFIYFLGHGIYTFLRLLNCRPKWETLSRYYTIRQEMLKQLDVLYLVKRINFLQKSLTFLVSEQQLKAMHLTSQLTLAEAAKIRRDYKLKSRLKQEIQSIEKDQNRKFNIKDLTNKNSNQFIDFENIDYSKPSIDVSDTSSKSHFDSDNYSSEDSSDQQENVRCLHDINEVRKDKKNELSKKIWKEVDIRVKQMIRRSTSNPKLKNEGSSSQDERAFYVSRPQTIEINKLTVERSPDEKSNEFEDREDFNDSANIIFPKLRTVQVQIDDRQC